MNTPPKRNASALAPFLRKTPAHIPHTVPKLSSYTFTDDAGGGGRLSCGGATGAGGGASQTIGLFLKDITPNPRVVIEATAPMRENAFLNEWLSEKGTREV